jgi:isopentenyl phosphate kinase
VIVCKFGGSVITEKDRRETLDGPTLDALASAVADCEEDLVVVHGAGSFGHYYADEHGAGVDAGIRDIDAIMDVHGAMKTLNSFVLSRLQARDVPAVPVHPFSVGRRDAEGTLSLPLEQVGAMVEEGFVPVLHGDGVVHEGEGVTILSGDEVVVRLARDLDADRVGMVSTVPGVLDESGDVIAHIERFEDVAAALGGSDATDVTGGMAGKVKTLLDLDATSYVFDPEALPAFLRGEAVGTRIDG